MRGIDRLIPRQNKKKINHGGTEEEEEEEEKRTEEIQGSFANFSIKETPSCLSPSYPSVLRALRALRG
ncbi:MAG: hypothetical protein CVV45_18110 [Spirochaetae bacterium HGW-Spirochaetae-10]|nr:MAG: hypothetical protein CVV45_18110 [Spirochaetae bacterium HGW-Spirochaetae-10]